MISFYYFPRRDKLNKEKDKELVTLENEANMKGRKGLSHA